MHEYLVSLPACLPDARLLLPPPPPCRLAQALDEFGIMQELRVGRGIDSTWVHLDCKDNFVHRCVCTSIHGQGLRVLQSEFSL